MPRYAANTTVSSNKSPDKEATDEQRRKAITDWWKRMGLREFIARKRATPPDAS